MINLTSYKSQKEAFLFYLHRMDIKMLDLVLDNNITYFGANKEVFLEKLSYIFNQLKLSKADWPIIEQHCEKINTYFFISEIYETKNEIIIDEKDGNLLKVFSRDIIKDAEDIEMLNPFEFFFGDDEKIDFTPSNDYVINLHHCINAYENIINDKIQILTSEDISDWLNKNKSLYKGIKDEYLFFKYNNFRHLYFRLKLYYKVLKKFSKAKRALKEFNNSDEISLNKWLNKFERLFFCFTQSFYNQFSEIDEATKTLKICPHPNIYFKGDDFLTIVKFSNLYVKHCPMEPINFSDYDDEVVNFPF